MAVTALHGPVDVLLAELQASRGGLTADDARRRLGEVGPNEPARAPRDGRSRSNPPAPRESAGHHPAARQRGLRDPRRAGQRGHHRPHGGS